MSDHGGGGGHYGGGHYGGGHYGGGHHGGGTQYGHVGHHGSGHGGHGYGVAPVNPGQAYPGSPPGPDYWGPSAYTSYAHSPDYPDRPYAAWGRRAGAYLLDMVAGWGLLVLALGIGGILGSVIKNTVAGEAVAVVLAVAVVAWYIYNRCLLAGRTGQSMGKRIAGIRLIDERTGQPIGGLMAFARDLAHIVDGITFYIGYLMPLWDPRKQTFADKITHTVVVRAAATGGPRPGHDQSSRSQTGYYR